MWVWGSLYVGLGRALSGIGGVVESCYVGLWRVVMWVWGGLLVGLEGCGGLLCGVGGCGGLLVGLWRASSGVVEGF